MNQLRQTLIRQNRFLLAITLCAFVVISLFNYRFNIVGDLSYNNRNSLHPDTQKLLQLLKDDISITAFVSNKHDKKKVKKVFKPLFNYKKNIHFTFINPIDSPKTARELGYNPDTPIHIHYQKKTAYINKASKAALHNTLQTLLNKDEVLIAFSSGFGERRPYNDANFNYSQINQYLREHNFTVIETDLSQLSNIPENAAALVMAAPVETLDTLTIDKIVRYINQGGNILWLADTDSQPIPAPIADLLGIQLLEGVVVDANSQKYIENKPDFVPVEAYPQTSFLHDMTTVSLFPQARGLHLKNSEKTHFQQQTLLQSSISSWTETGRIRGNIAFDENTVEVAGPITIGAALSRAQARQQDQRIVFLGDADFIANAYLYNADNINLALRLFKWLSYQQELVAINAVLAKDKELSINNNYFFVISLIYIIILPGIFLAIGIWLWYKRKNS